MEKKISDLENLRKRVAWFTTIIIAVSAIVTLYLIVKFLAVPGPMFILAILIGAGVGFLLSYVTGNSKMLHEFQDRFKILFVKEPFQAVFNDVVYDRKLGFPKEKIKATKMMTMGNRYYTNDYISGYYKDVRFERADVKIQQHTSNGKTSTTITYFNGRWMIFEFNKEFTFDLQIVGKGFSYSRKNKSIFIGSEDRRHKLELEDMHFNELFTVYAQDDHEAYYILTPAFMAVLKNMYGRIGGNFMLGFVRNQLHVAINTRRDSMEPSLFSSIESYKVKQDVQREINAIINIIDGLDLDRDIYKN